MEFWFAVITAISSTFICLYLWFRDVRRIMTEQKSTVESAKVQLKIFREKAHKARNDPAVAAVLERSECIYSQAVGNYNQTLHKPWVYPPAILMGFRTIQKGGGEAKRLNVLLEKDD
ncbi:MAG: hypothetical protein ACI4D0_11680 [Lachnospira sp.]